MREMDEAVRPVTKWISNKPVSDQNYLSRKLENITTPHPFKLSSHDCASKNTYGNCKHERIKQEIEERQKNAEIEHLKQFRANPIPPNTFLPLFQQIQNAKVQKREATKEQLITKQRPFDLSCYKEPVCRCSSVPDLKSVGKEKNGQRFRATPLPKNHNGKPLLEIMAEQEILREIRLRRRAEQLSKSSALPFSIPRDTIKKHRFEDAVAKERSAPTPITPKPKSQHCIRPNTVRFEMPLDVRDAMPNATLKHCDKSPSKANEIICRRRSVSVMDCATPRMTYSAILREQANRERWKENSVSQILSSGRQKELMRMKRDLFIKITLNQPPISKEEKLQRFREDTKARMKEYHQEMQQMAERVKARPFLVERQSQLSAIYKLDKKFRELLQKQGLDEDFIFANSKLSALRHSTSDVSVESEHQSSSSKEGNAKRTRSEGNNTPSDSSNYTSDAHTGDQSQDGEEMYSNDSEEGTNSETELPERDVS